MDCISEERASEAPHPRRSRNPFAGLPAPFWNLVVVTLINRLGGFVVPFLALYLSLKRGASVSTAGLITAFVGAGAILAGPLGGALADNVGRKRTIVVSFVANAAALAFVGLSNTTAELAAACFVLGITHELPRPATQAMVADLVPPEDRTRAYSALYWAANAGFALASVVAGVAMTVSFTVLFVVDAATCLASAVFVALRMRETAPTLRLDREAQMSPPTSRARFDVMTMLAPFRDAAFRRFFFATLVIAMVFFQFNVTVPLHVTSNGLSTAAYGLLIALNGVLVVALQPFAATLMLRVPRRLGLAASAILTGIGFGLFALGSGMPIYVLAIVVFTLGEVAMSPLNPTVVSELSPPALRGTYQGTFQLTYSVGACAAPVLGSAALEAFGGAFLWTACLGLGVVSAILHLRNHSLGRERAALPRSESKSAVDDALDDGAVVRG